MMRSVPAILLLAALGLGGCSGLPEQGFVTHAMGNPLGSVLRYNMTTATDFHGNTVSSPKPTAAPVAATTVHGAICERTAQERAADAARQGFDQGVQQHVYAQTLSDCEAWSALHTLH